MPTRSRAVRHLLNLFALLAATGAVLAIPAPVARADNGTIGISITPASATGPDERTRFSYQVSPGQRVTDHVLVSNPGTKPLKITMLAADAYNTDDGTFALRESATKATDAASWVSFVGGDSRLRLALAPGKSRIVTFTIAVPANATPGDHPAGVIASATTGRGKLAVERRIASRLYVRVSGDLQPVLTAANFSAAYASGINPFDGSVTMSAVINNTGNVALAGTVDVEVRTWFGAVVGKADQVELAEILPGNSRTVSFQVNGVGQAGYLQPHLLLRSAVSGDARDPGKLPVIERDAFLLAVPWLLLVVAALGVGGWFFLRWRRRRDEQRARDWVAFTEAEALRKLAGHDGDPRRGAGDTGGTE